MTTDAWLAFAGTLLTEGLVVGLLARALKLNVWPLVFLSAVLNLVTQPVLSAWLRFVLAGQDYFYFRYLALGEFAVYLIEALAYVVFLSWRPQAIVNGVLLSTAANGASLIAGLALPL